MFSPAGLVGASERSAPAMGRPGPPRLVLMLASLPSQTWSGRSSQGKSPTLGAGRTLSQEGAAASGGQWD